MNFALQQAMKPLGGRGLAVLLLYPRRKKEVGGQHDAPAAASPFPPLRKETRLPLYRRLGLASGAVWTGAENLTLIGIRCPDRPARSESLYRGPFPGPHPSMRACTNPNTVHP